MSGRLALAAAVLFAWSMLCLGASGAADARRWDREVGDPLPVCANTGWQDFAAVLSVGAFVFLVMAVAVAIVSVVAKVRSHGPSGTSG